MEDKVKELYNLIESKNWREKMSGDKGFRAEDQVFFFNGLECGIYQIESLAEGRCRLSNGETSFWANNHFIYHDHDLKIPFAIQEAIEVTENKPKRMVKRWVNAFTYDTGGQQWTMHLSKEVAESYITDHSNREYILIAHEIEVEEKNE